MAWFNKWDYNLDLSKGGVELSFRQPQEMASLLVENEAIRRVSQMTRDPTSPMLSSRHYLIGTRGLGKSTILNFIAYELFSEISNRKVIPVYVSLLGRAASEQDLEKHFFRSCLEGILDLTTIFPLYNVDKTFERVEARLDEAVVEYKSQIKKFGEISLEYVYTAFENQLKHLSEEFVKTIFLVDGLDKQDTEYVLGFFRNTQERFNTLIAKFSCAFIDAADPSWRDSLETREFSGVRGVLIALRGWTLEEVELLIRKRLELAGVFKVPFEKETLQTLVEDFQGNPREILQHATALLHYAARQRITSIEPRIARSIVWKEEAKQKLHDSIVSDPDLQIAYSKIKGIFNTPQLMNILIATYVADHKLWIGLDYERRSSFGITLSDSQFPQFLQMLKNRGCLRDSKIANHVELENDILKLFNTVNELKQPLVTLPVVLSELSSKIITVGPEAKEEVSLKDEIKVVFQQNPRTWLTYTELKNLLLENPKRQSMFETSYGPEYGKTISSSIPLIVAQLYQDGHLLKDEESSSFRWRPNVINAETAISIPYKDILDEVQAAKEMVSSESTEGVAVRCNAMFNTAISKLDSLFQKKISGKPLSEMAGFFGTIEVDVERPVPLKIFVEMLKNVPLNKEEADLCISVTITYCRRILDKYEVFKEYEKNAARKLSNIQRCIVGKSKEKERTYFNELFLPLLTTQYGRITDLMRKAKLGSGFIELSADAPEVKDLLGKGLFLKSRLFRCPKCGCRLPIAISGELKAVNCQVDRTPMVFEKDVVMLSPDAYESWNVWIEEYARFVLESLPCRFVTSGVCVTPAEVEGLSSSYETDGIVVYKGLSVAVECIENVHCAQDRNDIVDNIARVQALGLFDALLLVYGRVDNQSLFDSTINQHRKLVFPVVVQSPSRFKDALKATLNKIEGSARA